MTKLKSPPGGMIVNNQFFPGGKFLPRVLGRIRDVVGRKKLSRDSEALYSEVSKGNHSALAPWIDSLTDEDHPLAPILSAWFAAGQPKAPEEGLGYRNGKHRYAASPIVPKGAGYTEAWLPVHHFPMGKGEIELHLAPTKSDPKKTHVLIWAYDPETDTTPHIGSFTGPRELADQLAERVGGEFKDHWDKLNKVKLSRPMTNVEAIAGRLHEDPSVLGPLADAMEEEGHPWAPIFRYVQQYGKSLQDNPWSIEHRFSGNGMVLGRHNEFSVHLWPHVNEDRTLIDIRRKGHYMEPSYFVVPGSPPIPEELQEVWNKQKRRSREFLARPAELPGSVDAPLDSPTLSVPQIRKIEDTYGVQDKHRISTKATRSNTDVENFLDHLSSLRLTNHELHKQLKDPTNTGPEKLTYMINHLAHEAGHKDTLSSNPSDWYTKDIKALETGIHRIYGWKPGSPESTIAKAIIALTSGGQNPKTNTGIAFRMLDAGIRRAGKDPSVFAYIPEINIDPHEEYKRKLGSYDPPGLDPQEWYNWQQKYGKGPYRTAEVGVHKGVVVYRHQSGKINPVGTPSPQMIKAAKKVTVPKGNPDLQAPAWSNRSSIITGLRDLKHLIEQKTKENGGNTKKGLLDAARFLTRPQSGDQWEKYFPNKKDIEPGSPGSLVFGPKFGAFFLNMAGDHSHLTPDMWWTRTWNRYLGTMKGIKAPRSPEERKMMFRAAQEAAKVAGLKSVAELQAVLWYYEQNLWRLFGAKKVESYSYKDGINHELKKRGLPIVGKAPKTV